MTARALVQADLQRIAHRISDDLASGEDHRDPLHSEAALLRHLLRDGGPESFTELRRELQLIASGQMAVGVSTASLQAKQRLYRWIDWLA